MFALNNHEKRRKKLLIVGGGIIGLSSAYFLSKTNKYDITVIDKDVPIKGASTRNAGTITLSSYIPWTATNIWKVIKENLLMYDNKMSILKFSLIFDSDFRYWMRKHLFAKNKHSIEQANHAILTLGEYSLELFDPVVRDITNSPEEIEYHNEPFINTQKGLLKEDIVNQITKFNRVKQHGAEFKKIPEVDYTQYFDPHHASGIFKTISVAYLFSCKVMNTFKFCEKMKTHLTQKRGVEFIQGEVKDFFCENNKINAIQYTTKDNETVTDTRYDLYLISSGIGSINIAKQLGLKVPIFGFKGHSLDLYVNPEDMPKASYTFNPENICIINQGRNSSGLVRVTGYSDLVGNDTSVLEERRDKLVETAKKYFGPETYDEEKAHHWVGVRPVSADDIPIMGKSSIFNNLFWNTGHGGRGITFSLGSGKILSNIISENPIEGDLRITDYSPSRFQI